MTKACFHCGEPVAKSVNHSVIINDEEQPMCCLGCKAVATAIVNQGLTNYYQNRTNYPQKPDEIVPSALNQSSVYDDEKVQKSFVTQAKDFKQAELILEGIVCAACIWLNEKHVNNLEGVISFSINFASNRANLTWDESKIKLSEILNAITAIGYVAHPFDSKLKHSLAKQQNRTMLKYLIVAGLGMTQAMTLSSFIYLGAASTPQYHSFFQYALLLVTSPVVFYSSLIFFKPAFRDLKNFYLGMDVPISLAIILSYCASVYNLFAQNGEVYFDSISMFVFFLLIGRFLEFKARQKVNITLDLQAKLIPTITTIKTKGRLKKVLVSEVNVGDLVIVKPGETIPIDGIVISGISSVNESMLSGESMPVNKTKSDQVIAGSINVESILEIKTQKTDQDTVFASIVNLINQAQATRPKISLLTNQIAAWFVGILLILAIITYVYWYLQIGTAAMWIVVSVLVVTCPCALSLATPVAVSIATGMLAKKGLLVTGVNVLENLVKITDVVFDKTGTLTTGKISISKIKTCSNLSETKVLSLAHALESYSEHPIAKAFTSTEQIKVKEVIVNPGQGISGIIGNTRYKIGSLDYIGNQLVTDQTQDAQQLVYLADNKQLLAIFYLQDSLRPKASEITKQLQKLGLTVHLFSGDQKKVTENLAQNLNIKHVKAQLLPDEKLLNLQKLQQKGKTVLMVGDGINDAPVLAAADVAIAMQNASNLTQNTADAVLLSENLASIGKVLNFTNKTWQIIKQNITWAIVYNTLALPLAMLGLVEPWMAALGMSLSSLLVVLNSLRLFGK